MLYVATYTHISTPWSPPLLTQAGCVKVNHGHTDIWTGVNTACSERICPDPKKKKKRVVDAVHNPHLHTQTYSHTVLKTWCMDRVCVSAHWVHQGRQARKTPWIPNWVLSNFWHTDLFIKSTFLKFLQFSLCVYVLVFFLTYSENLGRVKNRPVEVFSCDNNHFCSTWNVTAW